MAALLFHFLVAGALLFSLPPASGTPSPPPRVWGVPDKAEKHAIELDLECATYRDLDWLRVKRLLWRFFDDLERSSQVLLSC